MIIMGSDPVNFRPSTDVQSEPNTVHTNITYKLKDITKYI